jgi:hypothetical protein
MLCGWVHLLPKVAEVTRGITQNTSSWPAVMWPYGQATFNNATQSSGVLGWLLKDIPHKNDSATSQLYISDLKQVTSRLTLTIKINAHDQAFQFIYPQPLISCRSSTP